MRKSATIHYITNEVGAATGVIVPIALWKALMSERETAYLLSTKANRQRLLAAKKRRSGISLEVAREKLGI